jgi:hypothetical protein
LEIRIDFFLVRVSFGRRNFRRHWNKNRRLILIELNQLNHEFSIFNFDFLDESVQLFYSAKRRCGGKAFETRQAFARFLHKGIMLRGLVERRDNIKEAG